MSNTPLETLEEILGIEPDYYNSVKMKCAEGLSAEDLLIFLQWWNSQQKWTPEEWEMIFKKHAPAYNSMMYAVSSGLG